MLFLKGILKRMLVFIGISEKILCSPPSPASILALVHISSVIKQIKHRVQHNLTKELVTVVDICNASCSIYLFLKMHLVTCSFDNKIHDPKISQALSGLTLCVEKYVFAQLHWGS